MRILVIHQYYLGPGEPGGSRFNEMARLWREAGHTVTVVAGTLNYTTAAVPAHLSRAWAKKVDEDGVTVWRCHVPRTYNRGYVGRTWAFIAFTLSGATAVLRAGAADIIIATSPPLLVALLGWLAAIRFRAPWIFEVRDLWPESAITTGVLAPKCLLARMLYALERFACRRASWINVLTPAFKDDLLRRHLATPEKISTITNGADLGCFTPGARQNGIRSSFGWGTRIVAMYAGAHGKANAVGQLVDAAEHLASRDDILLVTVGDGPERARWELEAKRRGLRNLAFLGPQPKERMSAFVSACDMGIAVLQHNPTFRTVYPNKVFDYMACARPAVVAIDGAARRLVCDEARAGVFAEPENGEAIARAIEYLADHPAERARMGARGRRWVLANANRPALARKYVDVMSRVLRTCAPSMPAASA